MPLVRQMSGADDAELQAGYMEFCQIIGSIEKSHQEEIG